MGDAAGANHHVAALKAQAFTVVGVLGRGAFGTVYECICDKSHSRVAVKIISKAKAAAMGVAARVVNEVSLHCQLRHECIVDLLDFFEDDANVYLATEACTGGDMYQFLHRHGPLPLHEARRLGCQLLSAVAYMHAHGVLHRDLKLSNLLLARTDCVEEKDTTTAAASVSPATRSVAPAASEPFTLKVADYGLAVQLTGAPGEEHRTICGTPNYIAPEVTAALPHGPAADVYSAGCLLYCMLFGTPPSTQHVTATTTVQKPVGHNISHSAPPPEISSASPGASPTDRASPIAVPNDAVLFLPHQAVGASFFTRTVTSPDFTRNLESLPSSTYAASLIRSMLAPFPADRPSAAEALAHPFFQLAAGSGSADDVQTLLNSASTNCKPGAESGPHGAETRAGASPSINSTPLRPEALRPEALATASRLVGMPLPLAATADHSVVQLVSASSPPLPFGPLSPTACASLSASHEPTALAPNNSIESPSLTAPAAQVYLSHTDTEAALSASAAPPHQSLKERPHAIRKGPVHAPPAAASETVSVDADGININAVQPSGVFDLRMEAPSVSLPRLLRRNSPSTVLQCRASQEADGLCVGESPFFGSTERSSAALPHTVPMLPSPVKPGGSFVLHARVALSRPVAPSSSVPEYQSIVVPRIVEAHRHARQGPPPHSHPLEDSPARRRLPRPDAVIDNAANAIACSPESTLSHSTIASFAYRRRRDAAYPHPQRGGGERVTTLSVSSATLTYEPESKLAAAATGSVMSGIVSGAALFDAHSSVSHSTAEPQWQSAHAPVLARVVSERADVIPAVREETPVARGPSANATRLSGFFSPTSTSGTRFLLTPEDIDAASASHDLSSSAVVRDALRADLALSPETTAAASRAGMQDGIPCSHTPESTSSCLQPAAGNRNEVVFRTEARAVDTADIATRSFSTALGWSQASGLSDLSASRMVLEAPQQRYCDATGSVAVAQVEHSAVSEPALTAPDATAGELAAPATQSATAAAAALAMDSDLRRAHRSALRQAKAVLDGAAAAAVAARRLRAAIRSGADAGGCQVLQSLGWVPPHPPAAQQAPQDPPPEHSAAPIPLPPVLCDLRAHGSRIPAVLSCRRVLPTSSLGGEEARVEEVVEIRGDAGTASVTRWLRRGGAAARGLVTASAAASEPDDEMQTRIEVSRHALLCTVTVAAAAAGAASASTQPPAVSFPLAALPARFHRLYRSLASAVLAVRARLPRLALLSPDTGLAILMDDGPVSSFSFTLRLDGAGAGVGAATWRVQYWPRRSHLVAVTLPGGEGLSAYVRPPAYMPACEGSGAGRGLGVPVAASSVEALPLAAQLLVTTALRQHAACVTLEGRYDGAISLPIVIRTQRPALDARSRALLLRSWEGEGTAAETSAQTAAPAADAGAAVASPITLEPSRSRNVAADTSASASPGEHLSAGTAAASNAVVSATFLVDDTRTAAELQRLSGGGGSDTASSSPRWDTREELSRWLVVAFRDGARVLLRDDAARVLLLLPPPPPSEGPVRESSRCAVLDCDLSSLPVGLSGSGRATPLQPARDLHGSSHRPGAGALSESESLTVPPEVLARLHAARVYLQSVLGIADSSRDEDISSRMRLPG